MIEFGKSLREAREAKGYSVSQLAETTHILPQIIENLEREDFSKIVAPIYGRGFVKLYCEAVGIEPKPLIDEFMAIYNGERPPVIRMKEDAAPPTASEQPPAEEPAEPAVPEPPAPQSAAELPPAPEPEPPPPEPLPADDQPIANEPPPIALDPLSRPVKEPQPFVPGPDDLPFPEEKPRPKRDYRLPGYSMPEVPRSFWRFGVLIAATAVILALIFFGCRALYRATMRVPETTGETVRGGEGEKDNATPKPETRNQKPAEPRKPIAVPPLYID